MSALDNVYYIGRVMEYRKRFVPTCSSNSNNSPNKIFVRIREDLREKWCHDVGVEYCKVYTVYCCEDHFDEKNEVQIRTILPETWVYAQSEVFSAGKRKDVFEDTLTELKEQGADVLYLANPRMESSELSLVPEERRRVARKEAIKRVPKDKAFIVCWLHDLLDNLNLTDDLSDPLLAERATSAATLSELSVDSHMTVIPTRQLGQANISFHLEDDDEVKPAPTKVDSGQFHRSRIKFAAIQLMDKISPKASTSQPTGEKDDGLNLTAQRKARTKSALKSVGVQTDKDKKSSHVRISEKDLVRFRSNEDDDYETSTSANKKDVDKETQTKQKEKQD